MAKLTIKLRALRQLEEIVANVIEFTGFEVSGIRLQNDIFDKIEQIAFMPLSGRIRDDGSRECFTRLYRIVYDFDKQADEVIILAIIHSSRIYPRLNKKSDFYRLLFLLVHFHSHILPHLCKKSTFLPLAYP